MQNRVTNGRRGKASNLSFCLVFQQLRHNQQQISVLQNEVDTLRSDNVKLYEKIKFLQSYPTKVSLCQLLRNLFVLKSDE